jgi:hypothetical protein
VTKRRKQRDASGVDRQEGILAADDHQGGGAPARNVKVWWLLQQPRDMTMLWDLLKEEGKW